jgi:hypothetical protein
MTRIVPDGRTAALVVVFLVAAGGHVETLGYWFTATDSIPLIYTSRVTTPTDFIELFTKPLMYGVSFPQIYYRPISSLTYAVEYWVWGLTPVGYHLTNVVLHGLAATLVALAIGEVTRRTDAGVLAGLLFGLHPLAVELVPTAARRHDILATVFVLLALWLFVRTDGVLTRGYAGSLVAYALALGSKETALVFPGVLLAWALLRPHRSGVRRRFRSAVVIGIPFGAVTVAYLAVRTVVVGSVTDRIAVPSLDLTIRVSYRYLLAGVYPMDIIGQADAIAPELLVVAVALSAALCWLYYAGDSMADASGVRRVLFWLSMAVLAGLPIGLVVSADVRAAVAALALGPMWRFVGVLLVGASLLGLLSTVRSGRWEAHEGWRVALFFGAWFVLPLVLFLLSGEYTIRSSYGSLAPLTGLLSLVIVRALEPSASVEARLSASWRQAVERLRQFDEHRLGGRRFGGRPDARTLVAVAFAGLLVAPVVIPSPAFHSYDGWEDAGYMNRLTLTGLAAELEGNGDTAGSSDLNVVVAGTAGAIRETNRDFPHAKSITYMAWHTIEAWLELRVVEGNVNADVAERVVLEHPPASVSFQTTRRNGIVYVNVSYAGRQSATPLKRDAAESSIARRTAAR